MWLQVEGLEVCLGALLCHEIQLGALTRLLVTKFSLNIWTSTGVPSECRSWVVALACAECHSSTTRPRTGRKLRPAGPGTVDHNRRAQVMWRHTTALETPLIGSTLCPIQQRNKKAFAGAVIIRINVTGQNTTSWQVWIGEGACSGSFTKSYTTLVIDTIIQSRLPVL